MRAPQPREFLPRVGRGTTVSAKARSANSALMRRAGTALVLGVLAATTAPTDATEVYRWVDADGRVHFGDRPRQADAEAVDIAPPVRGGGISRQRRQRTLRLLEAYAAEREERAVARREEAAREAERRTKCEQARTRRYRYEHAQRIVRRDEDGNRVVLDGEDYDAIIRSSREAVEKWCGRNP